MKLSQLINELNNIVKNETIESKDTFNIRQFQIQNDLLNNLKKISQLAIPTTFYSLSPEILNKQIKAALKLAQQQFARLLLENPSKVNTYIVVANGYAAVSQQVSVESQIRSGKGHPVYERLSNYLSQPDVNCDIPRPQVMEMRSLSK